jgi:hypothetical protein
MTGQHLQNTLGDAGRRPIVEGEAEAPGHRRLAPTARMSPGRIP